MYIIFYEGYGIVPPSEYEPNESRQCGAISPDSMLRCTRQKHSTALAHVAGYLDPSIADVIRIGEWISSSAYGKCAYIDKTGYCFAKGTLPTHRLVNIRELAPLWVATDTVSLSPPIQPTTVRPATIPSPTTPQPVVQASKPTPKPYEYEEITEWDLL